MGDNITSTYRVTEAAYGVVGLDPSNLLSGANPFLPADLTFDGDVGLDRDVAVMPLDVLLTEIINDYIQPGADKIEDAAEAFELINRYYMQFGGRDLQYYVRTYTLSSGAQRTYIIFKGSPALRTIFQGTRYAANNPQIVQAGIGKLGAAGAIKFPVITFLVVGALEVVKYVLADDAVFSDLVVALGVQAAKMAIGMAVAQLTVELIFGTVAVSTVGVGVVAVGATLLVVGLVVGYALDAADAHWRITSGLQSKAREWSQRQPEKCTALDCGGFLYSDPGNHPSF